MRRYMINALHNLAELQQESDLWAATMYPVEREMRRTHEERLGTTQQVLDGMGRLCLVNLRNPKLPDHS